MACSEVLPGHEPRAPLAACAPPPKPCRPAVARQTCPGASSEGDLNVTLQLKRLTHPTSPRASDETVPFQSFSVINCYYFFRLYATIKGRLPFLAAASPPTNQRSMACSLKRLSKHALNTEGHGFQTPQSPGRTNCSCFRLIIPTGSISHGVWVVLGARALFQVRVMKGAAGTLRHKA